MFCCPKRRFLGGFKHIIGLDGYFLKGLVKGQLLVAIGRDGNNQMFLIAYAVVHNESTETWSWFIDQLHSDLTIGKGLGWSIVSDMQNVSFIISLFTITLNLILDKYLYS